MGTENAVGHGGSTQKSEKSEQLPATTISGENATTNNATQNSTTPIVSVSNKTNEHPVFTPNVSLITTQQQPVEANTGNDQVASDLPRQPQETTREASPLPEEFLPPASSVPSKPSVKPTTMSNPVSRGIANVEPPKVVQNTTGSSSEATPAQITTKSSPTKGSPIVTAPSKPITTVPPEKSSAPKVAVVLAAPPSVVPSPVAVVLDEESLLDEKLKLERKPLTDKYGPYLIPSDTCLKDARKRLHIALEQTRQLREAFTDRVYGKYRVCLAPPCSTEQLLTRILTDPAQASKELEQEISQLNDEKTIEKKEASKLNAEVLAAGPPPSSTGDQPPTASNTAPSALNPLEIMNAENAEQLMYISAGLSLIVLPEQDTAGLDMSRYSDRSPLHQVTGQRVKGISAAAASAGEVMLDRARKGAAMREERRRMKSSGMDYQNFSRLEFLANNPITAPLPVPITSAFPVASTVQTNPNSAAGASKGSVALAAAANAMKKTPPASAIASSFLDTVTPPAGAVLGVSKSGNSSGAKRPLPTTNSPQSITATIPSAAAKAIRARVQATMSVQTLLSLSPVGEELRTDGKLSAATLALMERGVGTQGQHTKGNQNQRYRHPFPESQGGHRRAIQGPAKVSDQLLSSAYMALSLPPLPSAKERRSRKRLANIISNTTRAGSERAKNAINRVLNHFVETGVDGIQARKRQRVSEISFLQGIQDFGEQRNDSTDSMNEANETAGSLSPLENATDPVLAFHVMQAVGLIQPHPLVERELAEELVFPNTLETNMFAIAEKRAMGDEGGVSRRSIAKLKKLHEKFTSNFHTFSESTFHLPLPQSGIGSLDNTVINDPNSSQDIQGGKSCHELTGDSQVPVLLLRGGGEALNDNGDTGDKDSRAPVAPSLGDTPKPVADHTESSCTSNQSSPSTPSPHSQQTNTTHTNVWNDPSRLVLMNSGYASGHQSTLMQHSNGSTNISRLSGHIPGMEHYHTNAIQLANQLRLSRITNSGHHGASDLAEYIGGLHPQSASPYDWSAVGAASAAAAASAQSLAALGISPHRSSLVHFPLQDRARTLLRDQSAASAAAHAAVAHRHQQAMAYLSAGFSQGTSPHFAHAGQTMLNPSAAFMGQSGIGLVSSQAQNIQRPSEQAMKVDPPRNRSEKMEENDIATENSPEDSKPPSINSSNNHEKTVGKSTDIIESSDEAKNQMNQKRKLSTDEVPQEQPEKGIKISRSSAQTSLPDDLDVSKEATENNTARNVTCQERDEFHERDAQVVPESFQARKAISQEKNVAEDPSVTPGISSDQVIKQMNASSGSSQGASRLQFFVPPAPPEIRTDIASLVLQARSNDAVELADNLGLSSKCSLVSYFIAVGTAVPIPKALVANILKEKFSAPSLKSTSLSCIPQSSRDAAVATILLWMWKYHEPCFQRAFAKSGRIDVEPECKWLMTTVAEKAAVALLQALEDTTSRSSSPLAIALMAIKNKNLSAPRTNQEKESDRLVTASLDLLIISTVSKGLDVGFKINANVDASLPKFNDLLDYLDESRKCALYSKSQERALLAALISRKATMSLSFSHAYVSSLVRAGEALGHGELFEVVQNEEVNVSTMIPYDVFTDETGAWEDPCRPPNGFNACLTGDDLMRQAHARAMVQKSLKKLQDRHNIKGGTHISGAYTDPPNSAFSESNKATTSSGASTPKASLKRRSSFSDPRVKPGTGSAVATSWSLYDPKHLSAPLSWKSDAIENTPYGNHNSANRPRSLSLAQFSLKLPSRGRGKHSRSTSVASSEQAHEREIEALGQGPTKKSTREIPWGDVAGIFQNVALPGTPKQADLPITPRGRTIFAPFVREVAFEEVQVNSYESDSDEDLKDESVLGRHQVVLDRMKDHLSTFLEARQKTQEKRRSRSSKT